MFEGQLVERHGQPQCRYATQQRREHDLQLHAGQLLAHALMPAISEPNLRSVFTLEIQAIGFGELARVPVGRRHVQDDARAVGPSG